MTFIPVAFVDKGRVVDPDPHGSVTFAWIRIRNIVPDPDLAKYEGADK